MTIVHFAKVSTMYPRVVISSLAKRLEKAPFCHSYTSFCAWHRDHNMPLQRFTMGCMPSFAKVVCTTIALLRFLSHLVFKAKIRCASYLCLGSSCHTYGQNVSIEYQCLYYIISYYKNSLQVQKGLNSGMDPILPQAVD
jgi:hypothetical protein